MSARVELVGLQELREALRQLPEQLKQEAGQIVVAAAEEAKRDVIAAYPHGPTGNLKRGVTMQVESSSGLGTVAHVKSNAKHVYIFEKGTVQRHTNEGWSRGRMPVAPEAEQMIPVVIRARRRMVANLIDMVQRAGLVVTQS